MRVYRMGSWYFLWVQGFKNDCGIIFVPNMEGSEDRSYSAKVLDEDEWMLGVTSGQHYFEDDPRQDFYDEVIPHLDKESQKTLVSFMVKNINDKCHGDFVVLTRDEFVRLRGEE